MHHGHTLRALVVVVVQQNNVCIQIYSEIREELLDFLCLSGFFSHTFKNLEKNIDPLASKDALHPQNEFDIINY